MWTGVEKAELRDGLIVGWWQQHPGTLRVDPEVKLLEEFANWPDSADFILRFTMCSGPLESPFKAGEEFRFHPDDWRLLQKDFRTRWEAHMESRPIKGVPLRNWVYSPPVDAAPGEQWEFDWDYITYTTTTLYRLLLLELQSQPRERLRKCLRPDCLNPYFFPARRQQRYCSEPCAQWAQRKEKREWWNREGSKRRRKQKAQAKKARPKR